MWPKIGTGLILSFVLVFFAGAVLAHPPSNITLTFDMETQVLRVAIPHGVSNPKGDHYIDQVVVSLNGKEMITQFLGSQYSPQEQVVLYQLIDAKVGDTIEVYARCNKFGDRKVTWKIQ